MLHNLPAQHARRGATLVEVLMALLVMAIGVTSVFTLFPLAMLKSVKASQLTNAKLYEGSIEDMILATPQVIMGAPEWEARTQYDYATTPIPANVWPYPSRWAMAPTTSGLPASNTLYYATNVSSGSAPFLSGFSAPFTPSGTANRLGGAYRINIPAPGTPPNYQDNATFEWFPYKHSPLPGNWTWSGYMVDPLGFHATPGGSDQWSFGRIQTLVAPANNGLAPDRIHCQLSSDSADKFFKLPDSWSVALETTPVIQTYSPATPNLLTLTFPDLKPELVDAVTLSNNNRIILSSTLVGTTLEVPIEVGSGLPNNPTAGSPVLQVYINPATIPAGFLGLVDQARIEVKSPSRYSWLMAVQLGPEGQLEAQAAVVFNRSFEIEDEQGYEAEFCASEDTDLSGDLTNVNMINEDTMWPNGRIDINMAKIRWPATADGPKVKEGSYILDANHVRWYQISKIVKINDQERVRVDANDNPSATGTYIRMLMQLDSPVEDPGTLVIPPNTFRNANFSDYRLFDTQDFAGSAVLIPGVVHVFPVNQ